MDNFKQTDTKMQIKLRLYDTYYRVNRLAS